MLQAILSRKHATQQLTIRPRRLTWVDDLKEDLVSSVKSLNAETYRAFLPLAVVVPIADCKRETYLWLRVHRRPCGTIDCVRIAVLIDKSMAYRGLSFAALTYRRLLIFAYFDLVISQLIAPSSRATGAHAIEIFLCGFSSLLTIAATASILGVLRCIIPLSRSWNRMVYFRSSWTSSEVVSRPQNTQMLPDSLRAASLTASPKRFPLPGPPEAPAIAAAPAAAVAAATLTSSDAVPVSLSSAVVLLLLTATA